MDFSSVHNILLLVKNRKTNYCMKIEKCQDEQSQKKSSQSDMYAQCTTIFSYRKDSVAEMQKVFCYS